MLIELVLYLGKGISIANFCLLAFSNTRSQPIFQLFGTGVPKYGQGRVATMDRVLPVTDKEHTF